MSETTTVKRTTYRLLLNVRHWSGKSYDDGVILESEVPFAPIYKGESLTIGDLEGYPESRLTIATVEKVLHALTGGSHLKHDVTIYAVQDKEP
jgi:hypothetical protein